MMRYIIVGFSLLLFFSCSDVSDQSYANFNEFMNTTESNRNCFPKIIDSSCTNLQCRSSLKKGESIGKLKYSNKQVEVNLLNSATSSRIGTNAFQIAMVDLKIELPEWFLNTKNLIGKTFWQSNNYFIADDTSKKTIYFFRK